ncbi:MAG: family 20 glycosylhydrolase [Anaerolineae bacterium]|nr:family 20 glycosylhydrolase [Anaerolineae bacterium]
MQQVKSGPQPGDLWRGLHVLLNNDAETIALASEVPALAGMGINIIIVEVDYNYAYASHPELRGENPIGRAAVQALVRTCADCAVRLIPQFQCLGHQSWGHVTHPLLVRYPQFDETPGLYPNNEGIYCRSWCPQHPEVNPIVFALFDELLNVFQADGLHVGMDEVFLIASEHCPRCRGHDPARLFAKAVNDYHAHLVGERGVEMLMWGDRLLDSQATGYGEWEAAANGTHRAIELIPRDIVICDWHYSPRDTYPSIPFFLEQGFRVWPSGWKEIEAVEALIGYALQYRDRGVLGYLCTTWGAVLPGELAHWPPLQKAMAMLR